MPSKSLAIVTLLLAALTSLLAMPLLAFRNGAANYRSVYGAPGALLPNTAIPIQVPKTGVQHLDDYLGLMSAVFWTDLDTRNVAAHTQGTHFLGTLTAAWILMLVEAHRAGASLFFLAFTYGAEVVGELIGVGTATPVWAAYAILTASSVAGGTKKLGLPKRDSLVLPLAFLAGHVLPTLAMIKLRPGDEGVWSQQTWVLLRLVHPVLALAAWVPLRLLLAPATRATVSAKGWYVWAIVASTLMHTVSLSPLLLLDLSPEYIAPAVAAQLDPVAIFVPAPFWRAEQPQITEFVQGVSQFLQWDEVLCSVSIVVWAAYMYAQARRELRVAGGALLVGAQAALLTALGGPGATAAFLMWQREELIEAAGGVESGKKTN